MAQNGMAKESAFPQQLTAEMLKDFKTTQHGSTHPRMGVINGYAFIAKCGSWSEYSSDDHVHNEYVADNFLRAAGFNVPPSREYEVDFGDGRGLQTIRLAAYGDTLVPLGEAWARGDKALHAKIRTQTVAVYPLQALIAGIDTFTWDNVKVDLKGNLWFVDNGASFDYRARGKKKGWFWNRTDVNDPRSGYLALAKNTDQTTLQMILGKVDADELWQAAAKCNFVDLIEKLPKSYQQVELFEYAQALDNAAGVRAFIKSNEQERK